MISSSLDPSAIIQQLFHDANSNEPLAQRVSTHFSGIYASNDALKEISQLSSSSRSGSIVRFDAMVQDTSPSPELYLAQFEEKCGGWGLLNDANITAEDMDYSNLTERTVIWATNIPGVSEHQAQTSEDESLFKARSYKFPIPDTPQRGAQVKIYDPTLQLKPTELVTFIGIYTAEPFHWQADSEDVPDVPTLHVLFTRPLSDTVQSYNYSAESQQPSSVRSDLLQWIAKEGLGEDDLAAEYVLLSAIARVHTRTPPTLPPTLTLTRFPDPPAQTSASSAADPTSQLPSLHYILTLLLPTFSTIPLTLSTLNTSAFFPVSQNEDLHSGRLQLPAGSTVLLTEQGVTEGEINQTGLLNLNAVQTVMEAQTLEYKFPFSSFSFPTDISTMVLAGGSKSAFFRTDAILPLRPSARANPSALYQDADKIASFMPSEESLQAFRTLIGVAKTRKGKIDITEETSKYIQDDFVKQRKHQPDTRTEDLVHIMMIAKLLALSHGDKEMTTERWERAKVMEAERKKRLLEDAAGPTVTACR